MALKCGMRSAQVTQPPDGFTTCYDYNLSAHSQQSSNWGALLFSTTHPPTHSTTQMSCIWWFGAPGGSITPWTDAIAIERLTSPSLHYCRRQRAPAAACCGQQQQQAAGALWCEQQLTTPSQQQHAHHLSWHSLWTLRQLGMCLHSTAHCQRYGVGASASPAWLLMRLIVCR
jgi:hypothetical protein